MNDLLADYSILKGTQDQSRRFIQTREKLDRVKEFYGKDAKINISGYSLGASQGRYLAERETGINAAYLYNSGSNPLHSFRDSLYDKVGISSKKNNTPITEYKTLSDPISFGSAFSRKDTEVIYVPMKKGYSSHSLENFS
jgi:putative lipase involved disintegration of autophagic bodies